MEKTFTQDTPSKLKILRSGDPKTMFGRMSPAEILDRYCRDLIEAGLVATEHGETD